MEYKTQDFSHLIGTPGFSDELLNNHFKLYEGYVVNTNKLIEKIIELDKKDEHDSPCFAELKRRLGWEWNGMRLHELYFGNLTKGSNSFNIESTIGKKITEQFGAFEVWDKYMRASGALRGVGWVVLYYDTLGDMVFSSWINEHDVGHPTGCTPLLVMDVFEHAYLTDYGLARADYIDAFMKAVDWEVVNKRFEAVK